MWRFLPNLFVVVTNAAAPLSQQSRDGAQSSRFPGAIRADQRDDATLIDLEGNLLERIDRTVTDAEIF